MSELDLARYPVLGDLAGDDRRAAFYAMRLHERFEIVGGCYLIALFNYYLFKHDLSIDVTPVIGWINDGTDEHFISHAWVERGGLKIDASLDRVEDPKVNPPGAVLVLDRVVLRGHTYTYYRERTEAARRAARAAAKSSPLSRDLVEMKEHEHSMVLSISKDDSRIREFLDNAPPGCTYDDLRALMT
jgi:hypothetical protein